MKCPFKDKSHTFPPQLGKCIYLKRISLKKKSNNAFPLFLRSKEEISLKCFAEIPVEMWACFV
jgi:hypothetical protein